MKISFNMEMETEEVVELIQQEAGLFKPLLGAIIEDVRASREARKEDRSAERKLEELQRKHDRNIAELQRKLDSALKKH